MKKQIKQLFVQDLAQVQGGKQSQQPQQLNPLCPQITTLACGEEPFWCSGC